MTTHKIYPGDEIVFTAPGRVPLLVPYEALAKHFAKFFAARDKAEAKQHKQNAAVLAKHEAGRRVIPGDSNERDTLDWPDLPDEADLVDETGLPGEPDELEG